MLWMTFLERGNVKGTYICKKRTLITATSKAGEVRPTKESEKLSFER